MVRSDETNPPGHSWRSERGCPSRFGENEAKANMPASIEPERSWNRFELKSRRQPKPKRRAIESAWVSWRYYPVECLGARSSMSSVDDMTTISVQGARASRRAAFRRPMIQAAIVVLGLLISFAFTVGDDLIDVAPYVAIFGLIPAVILWALLTLGALALSTLLRVLTRGRFREQWLTSVCLLLAVGLMLLGFVESRPKYRFRTFIVNPEPSSLSDLRMMKFDSFGDGYAWCFSFRLSPVDFDSLAGRLNLTRLAVDWEQRTAEVRALGSNPTELSIAELFPEEQKLNHWDGYQRPERAEFYAGDRMTVVADPAHTQVYVYVDRWRRPSDGR